MSSALPGCGNPLAFAEMRLSDAVLDLYDAGLDLMVTAEKRCDQVRGLHGCDA